MACQHVMAGTVSQPSGYLFSLSSSPAAPFSMAFIKPLMRAYILDLQDQGDLPMVKKENQTSKVSKIDLKVAHLEVKFIYYVFLF